MIAPDVLVRDLHRARLDAPQFREDFRRSDPVSTAEMTADIVATNSVVIVALALVISAMRNPSALEWSIAFFAFLEANLLEYIGHRYLMHGGLKRSYPAFKRHVLQHHVFHTADHMGSDRLTDMRLVLFPTFGMLASLAAVILPHALVVWPLAGANAAQMFVATMLVYFLNYEFMHYAYHVHENSLILRIPGVRWLRSLHRLHHKKSLMGRVNFNIAYPIFDFLLGTLEIPRVEDR